MLLFVALRLSFGALQEGESRNAAKLYLAIQALGRVHHYLMPVQFHHIDHRLAPFLTRDSQR